MGLQKIKQELKQRAAKGLNFGVEGIEEVIDVSSPLYNDFILLKSKYSDLMHIASINTLPYNQIELGLDRLRNTLLTIIDKMESTDLTIQEVKSDLKVQDLPVRRTNFFKLLDIHFENLDTIIYQEIFSGGLPDTLAEGRKAIFEIYLRNKREFRHLKRSEKTSDKEIVKKVFIEYFKRDAGVFEVYFNNIKHIISYTLQNKIEQAFFMNTLKSLLSRYEKVMIFYFAVCDLDPEFNELVLKAKLINPTLKSVLFEEDHLDFLNL